MENIQTLYVLDVETSGFYPYKGDVILEISIYQLNCKTYQYKKVFDTVIRQEITDKIKNCWLVEQGYITIEEIERGMDQEKAKKKIHELLQGNDWTSFHIDFDYSFLKSILPTLTDPAFCLMKKMTNITRIPKRTYGYSSSFNDSFKWPSLLEAYNYLYPDALEEKHRSDYDTELATKIAIKLLQFNLFTQAISISITKNVDIKLTYHDKNNKQYDIIVKPKKLIRGSTILEAYNYHKEKDQAYNLTRIINFKELSTPYQTLKERN